MTAALFITRCGFKDCTSVSEPQPTHEAMEKWLQTNGWKHVNSRARCPWCVLALRREQGKWGPDR